jgi:hypothetical protein
MDDERSERSQWTGLLALLAQGLALFGIFLLANVLGSLMAEPRHASREVQDFPWPAIRMFVIGLVGVAVVWLICGSTK